MIWRWSQWTRSTGSTSEASKGRTWLNAHKGGAADKRVSLEARPTGHQPVAVHAEAKRIDDAVSTAAGKAARMLDHLFGKLSDKKGH